MDNHTEENIGEKKRKKHFLEIVVGAIVWIVLAILAFYTWYTIPALIFLTWILIAWGIKIFRGDKKDGSAYDKDF